MAVYLVVATFIVQPGYGIENTIFDAINHAMTGQSTGGINHAMTGQSTGGFSTLDDSIAGYDSYAMELVHIPAMITGAISIPVYWGVLSERNIRDFTRDPQVRMLFGLFVVGVVGLTAFLARWSVSRTTVRRRRRRADRLPRPVVGVPYNGDPIAYVGQVVTSQAFRDGLFQYISAQTTTGWQTSAIGDWNNGAVMFIVLGAMLLGGSAGATVGGIKILRGYIIARGISWEVTRVFLPQHAIEDLRIGQRTFKADEANDEIRAAATFAFVYLLLLGVSLFVLLAVLPPEFTLADAIFEVATAQGTVGLSAGITGPEMPVIAEVLFIFQMWMGRLEIIPVLVDGTTGNHSRPRLGKQHLQTVTHMHDFTASSTPVLDVPGPPLRSRPPASTVHESANVQNQHQCTSSSSAQAAPEAKSSNSQRRTTTKWSLSNATRNSLRK